MRRWPTWLLVAALVALGAAAVADALRGSEKTKVVQPRPAPTPTRAFGPLIPPSEPAGSAMSGVLYFSDARHGCRLAAVTLPDLAAARHPKLAGCSFSLAPNGESALPGNASWSPLGALYARSLGGTIEFSSPYSHQILRFTGRAPAFKPDGTFTYVRSGEAVEWTTRCPPGSSLFTLAGDNATARCRIVVAHRPMAALAWLTNRRFAALDASGKVTIREGGRIVARVASTTMPATLQPSPHGSYFAIWSGNRLVGLFSNGGGPALFPQLSAVYALAWSPDERWTAAATRRSVYLFRTNEGEARVRRLPIQARDLAWR